jgi:hypothetical protein
MWTPDWGYYVLATAHIDHAECTNGWSGRSEVAEHRIAQDANEEFVNGYVNEDCCYFHNPAGYKDYVHHITENDGYATAVFLP